MAEMLKISFEPAFEDDPSPHVVIYNPRILPSALASQVARFGLVANKGDRSLLSGKLKGSRAALTEMIVTYGLFLDVIPASYAGGFTA